MCRSGVAIWVIPWRPNNPNFSQVLDRDEAERRFRAALNCTPRDIEVIPLDEALGRVLGADVVSPVDVPSFDRASTSTDSR